MHVFMDAFQGCYRTHPQDLRYFSAFYLLLRILLLVQWYIFHTKMLYSSGIISLVAAAAVTFFQPSKVKAHNTRDVLLILLMGIFFLSYNENNSITYKFAAACEGVSVSLLILYLIWLVVWKVFHLEILKVLVRRVKGLMVCENRNDEEVDSFTRDHDSTLDHNYPPLLTPTLNPTY